MSHTGAVTAEGVREAAASLVELSWRLRGADRDLDRSVVSRRAGLARPRTEEKRNCGSNSIAEEKPSTVGAGSQTHEVPMLQVPVPVDGQSLKSQTKPHSPQLYGSVWMLTHWLSQAVCSGGLQV
jgi:hypothetical protein